MPAPIAHNPSEFDAATTSGQKGIPVVVADGPSSEVSVAAAGPGQTRVVLEVPFADAHASAVSTLADAAVAKHNQMTHVRLVAAAMASSATLEQMFMPTKLVKTSGCAVGTDVTRYRPTHIPRCITAREGPPVRAQCKPRHDVTPKHSGPPVLRQDASSHMGVPCGANARRAQPERCCRHS